MLKKAYELYYSGEQEIAFPLLVRGAEAGFIPACVTVGDCYWHGNGVEADRQKAMQYYLTAVEMGDTDAMMRMGEICLLCGETQKSIETYIAATPKGVADAYFKLGSIYYYGVNSVERDHEVAASYFEKYLGAVKDDAKALH